MNNKRVDQTAPSYLDKVSANGSKKEGTDHESYNQAPHLTQDTSNESAQLYNIILLTVVRVKIIFY